MKQADFDSALRAFAKDHLSPTAAERALVAKVYAAIQSVLGEANCIQIGSYPRFTAITPLKDLDVLYSLGVWTGRPDAGTTLSSLKAKLEKEFHNPTPFAIRIALQTHSITITFVDDNKSQRFAVDIVPAYERATNEFGDSMYMVPEIAKTAHARRHQLYEEAARGLRKIGWLRSDPRGYITVATRVNNRNPDFRKSVKLPKAWRAEAKRRDDSFALKAFHIEQVITGYFLEKPSITIFEAVFRFFCDLPSLILAPSIPDRADASIFIDEYVRTLTPAERRVIIEARDGFLIALEDVVSSSDVLRLPKAQPRRRRDPAEQYLFDSRIPVLTEHKLRIAATATQRKGGFMKRLLDAAGVIDIDRNIEFRIAGTPPPADLFKWKVKNDDRSPQPRGEITEHRTRNDPEHTLYGGEHYVECYGILDGRCVARARQPVVLHRGQEARSA